MPAPDLSVGGLIRHSAAGGALRRGNLVAVRLWSAIAAACLLVTLAGLNWFSVRSANQAYRRENVTRREIAQLQGRLTEAESGQRGFIITGEESYLEPYRNATLLVPKLLASLRRDLSNEAALTEGQARISDLAFRMLAEIKATVEERRQHGFNAATAVMKTNDARSHMEQIRRLDSRMLARQTDILEEAFHRAEDKARNSLLVTLIVSLGMLLTVALINFNLERERGRALAANQAKNSFLAHMSHELRTPLNAIIGYSEMLQEEAAAGARPDSLVADLDKIRGAGKHLLALINSVLDLSKVEAGKMDLFLETFSVPALVEEVASILRPFASQNKNRLTVDCSPSAGEMRSDHVKVRQSLLNLVSNACKFTRDGEVHVSVARVSADGGDFISFTVSDTGIGMTAQEMSKVFEPFVQADSSITRQYGGTGLGLPLSRRFAQLLGGDISARSEKGRGSVFELRVPAHTGGTGTDVSVKAPQSPNLVLVIDDDRDVHDMFSRTLEKQGFTARVASSGEQGLKLARALRPALITLDISLPGMDGWSVLTSLKSDPDLASVPVVIVTIDDRRELGFSLGAADYLTKPVDRDRLLAVLEKHRAITA